MSKVRPATVVELGTHNGFSFFTFCEAARRLQLDSVCFALDTWQGDEHAGYYGEDIYNEVRSVATEYYPNTAVLMRGYFDDFLSDFESGTIDLLHIDGRHGYDDVKRDFETWSLKVSERGVVLLHDINEHGDGFGVWRLWNELSERYPSFSFSHGHGLGVVSVGKEMPASLQTLFKADDAQIRVIRKFYADRGAIIAADYAKTIEINSLRAQRDAAQAEAEIARAQLLSVGFSYSWRITKPLRSIVGLMPTQARRGLRRALHRVFNAFRR